MEFGSMESAEDVVGALMGGVNDGDARSDDIGDEVLEDGIMSAAKDEDIDVFAEERLKVLFEREADDGVIVRAAFFDDGYEEWGWTGNDMSGGLESEDCVEVGSGADGGLGANDADAGMSAV